MQDLEVLQDDLQNASASEAALLERRDGFIIKASKHSQTLSPPLKWVQDTHSVMRTVCQTLVFETPS